jgi:hypothetical protein
MNDRFLEKKKRAGHIVHICIARPRILQCTTRIRLTTGRRRKLYRSSFARPGIDGVASLESPHRRQPSCSYLGGRTTLDCSWVMQPIMWKPIRGSATSPRKLGSFKFRQSSRRRAVDHEAVPGVARSMAHESRPADRRSNWPRRRWGDMFARCEGGLCPRT